MHIAVTELEPCLRVITISFAREQSPKGKLAQVAFSEQRKVHNKIIFLFFPLNVSYTGPW